MSPRPVSHIIENTHRKGIRFLENHAHITAKQVNVGFRCVDIPSVQHYLSRDLTALYQIVHTVQCLQQSRLATAAGTYESRDFLGRKMQIHRLQGMEIAVVQIQIIYRKFIHYIPFYHAALPATFFATRLEMALIIITIISSTTAVA